MLGSKKHKQHVLGVLISLVAALFIAACTSGSGGSSGGGCGTSMGCCPATGCSQPYSWYGSSTGLCYQTSTACHNAGNSNCRQCY